MSIEYNGSTIETNDAGFLTNLDDWNEDVARLMAEKENLTLTEKHWDLLNFLREEYFNNNGNQPNTRNIVKAMSDAWGEKIDAKVLYELFPGDPSKQAGRIAGLPESRRKGGY